MTGEQRQEIRAAVAEMSVPAAAALARELYAAGRHGPFIVVVGSLCERLNVDPDRLPEDPGRWPAALVRRVVEAKS